MPCLTLSPELASVTTADHPKPPVTLLPYFRPTQWPTPLGRSNLRRGICIAVGIDVSIQRETVLACLIFEGIGDEIDEIDR